MSHLKGIVLCPYEGSDCYQRFATPRFSRPHRDFMYNATYEAIKFAYTEWHARRIGIAHLCRSKVHGKYHPDMTTCQVEAVFHFCNQYQGIESISFVDDYESNQPLGTISEFAQLSSIGNHRDIFTSRFDAGGVSLIDLDWSKGPSPVDPYAWANAIPESGLN